MHPFRVVNLSLLRTYTRYAYFHVHCNLMTTVFYRHILPSAIFCLVSVFTYGQSHTTISESLNTLSDSLLKTEIASFTVKGSAVKQADNSIKTTLIEIPVRNCAENKVDLYRSTFTSSVSTFIHLYFKGDVPDKTLDSIFLVTHAHLWVRIPENAYKGLPQSHICNFIGGGKKAEFYSPNYKAFYSQDKRRLYIYMLAETTSSKYEVTWVIINDQYFTRVLDHLQWPWWIPPNSGSYLQQQNKPELQAVPSMNAAASASLYPLTEILCQTPKQW